MHDMLTPRPDIVLVTVNRHETRAIHDAFLAAKGAEAKPVQIRGRIYHDLGSINGTTVYHVISEMGSSGQGAMQQAVDRAIRALDPGAVIAIGIAFGVDEKAQNLGDILLSKQIQLYDLQRAGEKKIVLRGDKPHAAPRLINYFDSFNQVEWKGARVHTGLLLSGEKLIDNKNHRDQLVALQTEAIGGEMEGAGLYVSSHDHKVDWIVIKAICDWADGKKWVRRERRQQRAAKNAADFLVGALRYCPLKRIEYESERMQSLSEHEKKHPSYHAPATRRGSLAGLTIDVGVDRDGFANVRTGESYPPERMLRYTPDKEATGDEEHLVVKPDMGYLTALQSGAPIEAIKFYHDPFLCQFPNLDVTFVNNTGETLVVIGATFEVDESVPDMRPLIIFKDDNARMILAIRNEGWGTVRNAVLRCNIVPTSAEAIRPDPPIGHISIAGPYGHEFAIGDFEDEYELNLESTFAGLGIDIPAIMEAGFRSQIPYVHYAMDNGLDRELWQHYGRFPQLDTNDAWRPFPDGYAVVAGVLEYNEDSGGGATNRRLLPFRVKVFLFKTKLSLPMPPSYQYNVSLKPDGKQYEAFCPISQALKAGEPDRIRIYVACERSATHKFRIKWLLNDGKEKISEPIALTHFVPKTWSKRPKTQAEVGPPQDAPAEPRISGSGLGCVEEAILLGRAITAVRLKSEAEKEKQPHPAGDKPASH